jgi:hypothetical protein
MKHDDGDNTMKLSYNKQLRTTAVITLELLRTTSYWKYTSTKHNIEWSEIESYVNS